MKLAHIFFDVNMSKGHKGLGEILKSNKKKISDDTSVIFINKRWTALKMLTSSNVILHLKTPKSGRIDPNTIKYLPHCVDGGEIDYSKALKAALDRDYRRKGHIRYE